MPKSLTDGLLDLFFKYTTNNYGIIFIQSSLFYRDVSLYVYGHSFFQTGEGKVSVYEEDRYDNKIIGQSDATECQRPENCYFSPSLLSVILESSITYIHKQVPKQIVDNIKQKTQWLLSETITQPASIPNLQAFLLQSWTEFKTGNFSQSWLYAGIAFKQEKDLEIMSYEDNVNINEQDFTNLRRINNSNNKKNRILIEAEEDLESRRRITWTCFIWDKLLSLYLNRIPVICSPPNSNPNDITGTEMEDLKWTEFPDQLISNDFLLNFRLKGHKQRSNSMMSTSTITSTNPDSNNNLNTNVNTAVLFITLAKLSTLLNITLNSIHHKRHEIALNLNNKDKTPQSHLYFVDYIPTKEQLNLLSKYLDLAWESLPMTFKLHTNDNLNSDNDGTKTTNFYSILVNILYWILKSVLTKPTTPISSSTLNNTVDDNERQTQSFFNCVRTLKDLTIQYRSFDLNFPIFILSSHILSSFIFATLNYKLVKFEDRLELKSHLVFFINFLKNEEQTHRNSISNETVVHYLTPEMLGDLNYIEKSSVLNSILENDGIDNDNENENININTSKFNLIDHDDDNLLKPIISNLSVCKHSYDYNNLNASESDRYIDNNPTPNLNSNMNSDTSMSTITPGDSTSSLFTPSDLGLELDLLDIVVPNSNNNQHIPPHFSISVPSLSDSLDSMDSLESLTTDSNFSVDATSSLNTPLAEDYFISKDSSFENNNNNSNGNIYNDFSPDFYSATHNHYLSPSLNPISQAQRIQQKQQLQQRRSQNANININQLQLQNQTQNKNQNHVQLKPELGLEHSLEFMTMSSPTLLNLNNIQNIDMSMIQF